MPCRPAPRFPRFPRTPTTVLALWAFAATAAAQQSSLPPLPGASQIIMPQARAWAVDGRPQARPAAGVEIESVSATVGIIDATARTTLDIAMRNHGARQEEAVLLLPVPRGAAVTAFDFQGPASEPTTQVLAADEARRLYDSIVAKVRDPALLEFAGYSLVRSSVFPVPAGGTQKVRLTYEHVLDTDGRRIDYVLPRSESLDRRVPWTIDVTVRSGHAISTVYSPSHDVVTQRRGDGEIGVRLAGTAGGAAYAPGSFRLSYLGGGEGVTASLMAYPDPEIGGGYFLLMAGLPAGERPPRVPREVTVVIDRSGSMAGGKLDQARAAVLQVVEGLDDGERFNIVDYATSVSSFAPEPIARTDESLRQARRYLAGLRPGGGTNLHDALVEALRPTAAPGTMPMVLFLTDGLATIGRTSERAIRDLAETANPSSRRIFTFGVGTDVNVPLLDRLADATRGTATYVVPGEDVEVAVAAVFRRLAGPVLADLEIAALDGAGAVTTRRVADLMPSRLPDLFEGDHLILLGRYQGDDPLTLELRGRAAAPRTERFTFDLSDATTRNAFVARLWASRQIAVLVDEVRQAGADATMSMAETRYQELVDEIVRLSTRFGVLTEYTAFLATEGTDLSNHDHLVAGCRRQLDSKALATRWGSGAVNQGLNFNSQKLQSVLNYDNRFINDQLEQQAFTSVQQINDRAFFRRGNRWIDSRVIAGAGADPDDVYILGSEAHRELLRRLAGEGRAGVLSLPGEILLEVDGRLVLVKDGC